MGKVYTAVLARCLRSLMALHNTYKLLSEIEDIAKKSNKKVEDIYSVIIKKYLTNYDFEVFDNLKNCCGSNMSAKSECFYLEMANQLLEEGITWDKAQGEPPIYTVKYSCRMALSYMYRAVDGAYGIFNHTEVNSKIVAVREYAKRSSSSPEQLKETETLLDRLVQKTELTQMVLEAIGDNHVSKEDLTKLYKKYKPLVIELSDPIEDELYARYVSIVPVDVQDQLDDKFSLMSRMDVCNLIETVRSGEDYSGIISMIEAKAQTSSDEISLFSHIKVIYDALVKRESAEIRFTDVSCIPLEILFECLDKQEVTDRLREVISVGICQGVEITGEF